LLGEQTRRHADLDLWVPAERYEHLVRAPLRAVRPRPARRVPV